MSKVVIGNEEAMKLYSMMKATNKNCPLVISFNRTSGVILKAALACDPLARLEVQSNEG